MMAGLKGGEGREKGGKSGPVRRRSGEGAGGPVADAHPQIFEPPIAPLVLPTDGPEEGVFRGAEGGDDACHGRAYTNSLRPPWLAYFTLARMKRVLWPALWLLAVALLSAAASAAAGMAYWWAFCIVAAALAVNGWVATLEDDLPGGFNNPGGMSTPRYAVVTSWVVRGVGAVLLVLCLAVLALHLWSR